MFGWFLRLFTHTGVYGQGESGIIDFGRYFTDILSIFKNNLSLTFSLLAGNEFTILQDDQRQKLFYGI